MLTLACPEAERLCGPGQSGADCLCVSPPGSVTALQYEVTCNGVPGVQSGSTLRDPIGEVTSEMVSTLEAMRQFHFGK